MNRIASLALAFTLAAGCAGAMDGEDLASAESEVVGNSITLGSFSNNCAPGNAPQVVFGGVDAAGRESYTVQGIKAQPVPGSAGCQVRAQLLLAPGHRARIKGVTYFGNFFRSTGAFGTFKVLAGLRTAPTYTVSSFLPQGNGPAFSKSDFSMPLNDWTQCSRSAFPGETLFVSPSVTVQGGIPGQIPSLSVDLNALINSLEVETCTF